MSDLLIAFLKDYLLYAKGESTNTRWRVRCGLCSNALAWPEYKEDGELLYMELSAILSEEFPHSTAYPFGKVEYSRAYADATQHLNPKRLAWVRSKLAKV